MQPLIFDIKRYSINDGPGIRTTIFLKGCPLSCVWCHNPEGVSPRPQRMYAGKRCIGCAACIAACPQQAIQSSTTGLHWEGSCCCSCGHCADVCPSKATEISGKACTVDDLMKEIEKETLFMDQSGGGVTICGGEPLLYPDFLMELLKQCGRLGIHRIVDTTLYASPAVVTAVASHTDMFLVDLKVMDDEKHKRYCGVSNKRILDNLRMLAEMNIPFVIRIPLIEGINADEENIRATAQFVSALPGGSRQVSLLPYHAIGKGKHDRLGTIYNPDGYPMTAPSDETTKQTIQLFHEHGVVVTYT